jgi:hypothetical protein
LQASLKLDTWDALMRVSLYKQRWDGQNELEGNLWGVTKLVKL